MSTLANKSSQSGIGKKKAHGARSSYSDVARNSAQQQQQNDQQKAEMRKKAYMQRMAKIADDKIKEFVMKHFSKATKDQMTIFDHLKLRKYGTKIAIQLMVSRWIENIDWDLQPDECTRRVSKVLPIFGRLMTYCTKQQVLNQHSVKIDLVYDPDPLLTHESKMQNAEMFYLAVKELEELVHQKHQQKDTQLSALNSRFTARAWKRRPIGSRYKYVMSGAFIAKQLKEGRKAELDIGANALKAVIGAYSHEFMLHRLGGLQKKYISDVIVIETMTALDLKKMNVKHRRICSQRVRFAEFKKQRQTAKTKTEEEKINEMQRDELEFGDQPARRLHSEDYQDFDMKQNEEKETELEQQEDVTIDNKQQQHPNQTTCTRCGVIGHRVSQCLTSTKQNINSNNEDVQKETNEQIQSAVNDRSKQHRDRAFGVKRGGQGHRAYLNLHSNDDTAGRSRSKKRKGHEVGLENIDPMAKRPHAKTQTHTQNTEPTNWEESMALWKQEQLEAGVQEQDPTERLKALYQAL